MAVAVAEPWGQKLVGTFPAAAGDAVELIHTPDLEYPQPLTVQFNRNMANATGRCHYVAELQYRAGSFVRTVRCDWRSMATVMAQQLTVRAVSALPSQAAAGGYSAGGSAEHSAMVGIGHVPHDPPELSEAALISFTPDAFVELPVAALAKRARFHVYKAVSPTFTTFADCFDQVLTGGTAKIDLAIGTVDNIVHSEPLRAEHLTQGIELGNADWLIFTGPYMMQPDQLLLDVGWVLSL